MSPSDHDFPGFEDEDDDEEPTVMTSSTPVHEPPASEGAAAEEFPPIEDDGHDDDEATVLTASASAAPVPSHEAQHAPAADDASFPADFEDDEDDEATAVSVAVQNAAKAASAARAGADLVPPQVPAPDAPASLPALNPMTLRALRARAPTAAASGEVTVPADAVPELSALRAVVPEAGAVLDGDVDDALQLVRRSLRVAEDRAPGEPLERDDEVCVDVVGFAGEQEIPGSRQTRLWMTLDPDADLPGVMEALATLRVGEAAEIEATDGRTRFAVRVVAARSIRSGSLTDPAFLSATGFGATLDEVRAKLRAGIEERAADLLVDVVTARLLDALIDGTQVELDDALVEQEVRLRWEEANRSALPRMEQAAREAAVAPWLRDDEVTTSARRALRLDGALTVIAAREAITVGDEVLDAYIAAIARATRTDEQRALDHVATDPALRAQLLRKLKHQLAIQRVLERGSVTWGSPEG